ncbi:MAG TPA: PRC-barrel domain-containing protein [Alphaproteobacteria bacterium]|nr:PRC-barrel domain-containing protein [Alphaproteobacteria bacterium]
MNKVFGLAASAMMLAAAGGAFAQQQQQPPQPGQPPMQQQQAQGQQPPAAQGQQQQQQAQQGGQQQQQQPRQQLALPADADNIIGKTVTSKDGQEVGSINDVVVSTDGKIAAVIIEQGGALGMGGTTIAAQWDKIKIQGDQITLDVSQQEVAQLPEYRAESQ